MSKQGGMGDALYLEGVDLSGDVGSLSRIGGGPAGLEVTGISASGVERIGGVLDGGIDFVAWFNDASTHGELASLPTADVVATYLRGTTLGNPAAGIVAKQVNYDGTRGQDGSVSFAVQLPVDGSPVEWGQALTAGIRTDSGATNGTAVDRGTSGATDYGIAAYLHAFDFTGTDVTVKVQDSSDGSTGWADVVAFTQITGSTPLAERAVSSSTENVKQYLRAITITTGGFSDFDFAVVAIGFEVAW